MQNYLYEGISYNNLTATSGRVVSNGEAFLLDNNKKMKLDIIEQDLFTKKERTNSQEEINFD